MPRLIDADALRALYEGEQITEDMHCSIRVIRQNIDDMPAVEAEPIRYGHWYIRRFGADAKCSECGMSFKDAYDIEDYDKYCRHCGARMLGIAIKEWK